MQCFDPWWELEQAHVLIIEEKRMSLITKRMITSRQSEFMACFDAATGF